MMAVILHTDWARRWRRLLRGKAHGQTSTRRLDKCCGLLECGARGRRSGELSERFSSARWIVEDLLIPYLGIAVAPVLIQETFLHVRLAQLQLQIVRATAQYDRRFRRC